MRMRPHHFNGQTRPGTLFNRGAIKSGGASKAQARPGALFNRPTTASPSAVTQRGEIFLSLEAGDGRGKHGLAYAGVYLFTLMLYARPNDLFPALGSFPLVKIVAIGALLVYIGSKISAGYRLTVWTTEMTMLLVIAGLGVLLMPAAASPQDSLDTLTDTYLKTVIMFILMVNLIDTRRRLFSLWKLVVICGVVLGAGAINSYIKGEFTSHGLRIHGLVGGMFENPNDLATALDLLLPFAIVLTLVNKGRARLLYLICAVVMAIGVLLTLSRGGFLGLIAMGGLLLWKLGRGRRLKTTLAAALICGLLFAATPGGYGNRMATIFNIDQDQTGSAQLRRELMERAASIAISRPIVGVGMANFHIYSIHENLAHNSYLEIAAELGVIGLIAYLILIFAPLRSLRRIERQTVGMSSKSEREMYWLSVSIQAAFIAYMVCSFFASIQYLWYLYYTAAYAVALRRIHAAEEMQSSSSNNQALAPAPVAKPDRGALWQSYRAPQGIG
ncbi:MAG TPA: O-antigen ligase family protein [Blastocatellia bacterium]|nr:O-antigen ligase family protein [Blastocatellia bacterium]